MAGHEGGRAGAPDVRPEDFGAWGDHFGAEEDGDGLSARRPETPDCPDCGRTAELRPTDTGHWILLQPGRYPVAEVPEGRRWYDAEDGRSVVRGPGATARSADECRIAHRPVCAARAFSPRWWPLRAALWLHNRDVAGLPYE
ncbi:DUF6083 domain-containing protein [Streptomyces sp. URMC 126]|uniref:DUF6083 domain-containing protein n=1 Tax=Streptomyces sp. URMC 126 TaxID=3423401 RepID=UPI003F1E3197